LKEFRIGQRLRHARENTQLSLQELSTRTGLSKGFLSKVERNETTPSIPSLISIAEAVGISMEELFRKPETTLVRASDRPTVTLPDKFVVDTLLTSITEKRVAVIETVASNNGSGGDQLYSIPSDCEVCYVIQGQIEINLDGDLYSLSAGDSLTFNAKIPHTWRSVSKTSPAKILWIVAPAMPDPLFYANVPERTQDLK